MITGETLGIRIPSQTDFLDGDLTIPGSATGIVLFAHGSGSSRMSSRNRRVAALLRERRLATLLMDLLTAKEELVDIDTGEFRFDIDRLATRLVDATRWIERNPDTRNLPIGYFGASTGAAAALVAAAALPDLVRAVVSRGGRPDLADRALTSVRAPTLLIVGENDREVIRLNEKALAVLPSEKHLSIVPGATHLFEEPGALEEVARLAGSWFDDHLATRKDATAT